MPSQGARSAIAIAAILSVAGQSAPAKPGDLLVADVTSHVIVRFSPDGEYLGVFASGGLAGKNAVEFGPDRRLYVCDSVVKAVVRYNGVSGDHLGEFVTGGSGDLTDPRGLLFGPDDRLYIASTTSLKKIVRFSSLTGAFESVFQSTPPQPRDMEIGPDGHLYAICELCSDVVRFDPTTGAALGQFIAAGPDAPKNPYAMEFGPDGHLYITSSGADDSIRRFDGTTGAFMGVFADSPLIDNPIDLKFSDDWSRLYVTCQGSNNVLVFDGSTGVLIAELVSAGAHGLGQLGGLAIVPCFADHDRSGFLDTDDYDAFVADFEAGSDAADFDQSGFVDTDDFDAFVYAFEEGC